MKYFLIVLGLALTGCSSPLLVQSPYNAIIPLNGVEVGVFIPESWEKVSAPSNGQNIVLMAQNGVENVVISFEYSDAAVTGQALCKGATSGLANFNQIFVDNEQCVFSGHPASNMPLRNFWQKIVRTPASNNFLLMSCSTELLTTASSTCPSILESFKILDKTE